MTKITSINFARLHKQGANGNWNHFCREKTFLIPPLFPPIAPDYFTIKPSPMTRLITLFFLLFTAHISAQNIFWISACSAQSFCVDANSCAQGNVLLTEVAGTNCNSTQEINYSYKIDLQNNGSIDIQSDADTVSGSFVKGTHKVTWRATDNCGRATTCAYLFTVKDCNPPSMVCLNGSTQTLDAPLCLGVFRASQFVLSYADNCTPKDQIQLGIRRLGAGVGFPTDTSITFQTCDQGAHTIEIWAKDANGLTNQCNSYVLVQDGAGGCACITDADVSAPVCVRTAINTRLADYRLRLKVVSVGGPGNPVTKTILKSTVDSCFSATIANLPLNKAYRATVSAERFFNPLNGVSTFDLVQISKHILGIEPLANIYQGVAADVNNSRSITASDIVETRKLILGIYDSFPNAPSWRIIRPVANPNDLSNLSAIKDTYQFAIPALTTDITLSSVSFVAIKTGDVNQSALSLDGGAESRGTPLLLSLADQYLAADEEVTVPIRLRESATLAGWQLALRTDPTALQISGVEDLPDEDYVRSADGTLRALWFDGHERNFAAGDVVITLKIKALRPVWLSRALMLNPAEMNSEAYFGKIIRRPLALDFEAAPAGNTAFFPPQPNPFAMETRFQFRLEQPGEATLDIFDAAGRLVHRETALAPAGMNSISLAAARLPDAGVYAFRLQAGGQVFTGRLVRM